MYETLHADARCVDAVVTRSTALLMACARNGVAHAASLEMRPNGAATLACVRNSPFGTEARSATS